MRKARAGSVLLLCMALGGCAPRRKSPVIAVIQSTSGTEYWTRFSDSARAAAGRYGFHLQWSAPESEADYGLQAKLLNDAVQRHVSGIILAPSHQLVLAEGVRRAYAEGIPVVIVHAPVAVQSNEYVTQIGCSDEAIGFRTAQRFLTTTERPRILVVSASPTLESAVQREESLRRALLRAGKQAEIAATRYSLSDWARARQVTIDALKSHPEINGIFATDEFSAHGVLSAVREVSRPRVLTIVGVQNDPEAQWALRSGYFSMSISCDSATEAQLAMQAMQSALQGQPVQKLIQTEVLAFSGKSVPGRP